jgi:hypothetical protein
MTELHDAQIRRLLTTQGAFRLRHSKSTPGVSIGDPKDGNSGLGLLA